MNDKKCKTEWVKEKERERERESEQCEEFCVSDIASWFTFARLLVFYHLRFPVMHDDKIMEFSVNRC